MFIFVTSSRSPNMDNGRDKRHHWKDVELTFYLRLVGISQILGCSHGKAMVGVHVVFNPTAWASALLILEQQAMREPQRVG